MNDLKFTAKVDTEECIIDYLNEFFDLPKNIDIEKSCTECTVDFHLEIEARKWGVKGISVIVDRVTAWFHFTVSKEDLEGKDHMFLTRRFKDEGKEWFLERQFDSKSREYDMKHMEESEEWEWGIETEDLFVSPYGQISIEGVEFDWKNRKINIH